MPFKSLTFPLLAMLLMLPLPEDTRAVAPAETMSSVAVRRGRLGFAGVHLGDTHQNAERRLKVPLPIESYEDALACGMFQSRVALAGHKVWIQWSANGPGATVEAIAATPTANEAKRGAPSLVDGLVRRIPSMKILGSSVTGDPSTHAFLLGLTSNSDDRLLLKTGHENVFFVSLDACLD